MRVLGGRRPEQRRVGEDSSGAGGRLVGEPWLCRWQLWLFPQWNPGLPEPLGPVRVRLVHWEEPLDQQHAGTVGTGCVAAAGLHEGGSRAVVGERGGEVVRGVLGDGLGDRHRTLRVAEVALLQRIEEWTVDAVRSSEWVSERDRRLGQKKLECPIWVK
jgi:hypothetical protein